MSIFTNSHDRSSFKLTLALALMTNSTTNATQKAIFLTKFIRMVFNVNFSSKVGL